MDLRNGFFIHHCKLRYSKCKWNSKENIRNTSLNIFIFNPQNPVLFPKSLALTYPVGPSTKFTTPVVWEREGQECTKLKPK